jgi:hypothetical protein
LFAVKESCDRKRSLQLCGAQTCGRGRVNEPQVEEIAW